MARVLVIDDHAPIRALLRKALEGNGHEVLEASNGRLGLELYRESPVDLIITDVVMPKMNGSEMMVDLIRDFPNAKVIAMSGFIENERQLNVAKLFGVRQTFQKPFEMGKLLGAVRYELAH